MLILRTNLRWDDWKNRYYELKGHSSDIDLSKYVDMGLYTEFMTNNTKLKKVKLC